MGFFDLPRVCILLLIGYLGTEASATSPPVEIPHISDRVLRAATRRSDLFRRDTRIRRSFDANLAYIESENGWQSNSIFASQVQIKSKAPILNLEDIEHHLNGIQCTESTIKLSFVSTVSARDARHACSQEHGGFIITSHTSCNEEGERSVYKVSNVALSEDEFSLELAVVETELKKAFDDISIDFGYTSDGHLFRRHSHFQARQQPKSSTPTPNPSPRPATPSGTAASLITPPPVPIPTNVNSSVTSASFDLSFQTLNSTFTNPLAGNPVKGLDPLKPLSQIPLKAGCKNCTTTGSLLLTQGSFQINLKNIDLTPQLSDVVKGGFVELQANAMGAHIELNSALSQSGSFDLPLFNLPVVGFAIPKLGSAGVTFNGSITTSYEINGGIDFTYGFDLNVPSGSKMTIDFTNFNNSKMVGFDGVSLSALPFTANLTDVDLKLSVGFRPKIPIGLRLSDQFTAQVEAFMDLPKLEAKLSTKKQGADAQCQPLNGTANGNSTIPTNSTSPSLVSNSTYLPSSVLPSLVADIGPLVLIEPAVNLALGVGAEFDVQAIPGPGISTGITFYSTRFTLPTACLAIASGFTPAAKVLETKTASYIASASSVVAAAASKSAADASSTAGQPGKARESNSPKSGAGRVAQTSRTGFSFTTFQFLWVSLGVVAGGMVLL